MEDLEEKVAELSKRVHELECILSQVTMRSWDRERLGGQKCPECHNGHVRGRGPGVFVRCGACDGVGVLPKEGAR